jgi:hypothetical protein
VSSRRCSSLFSSRCSAPQWRSRAIDVALCAVVTLIVIVLIAPVIAIVVSLALIPVLAAAAVRYRAFVPAVITVGR